MAIGTATALALGLGALGAGSGFFGQRSQNQQAQREYDRVNALIQDWLKKYEEYQGDLRTQVGGMPGLFGPRTTTTSGTSSFENLPVISPEFQPIAGMLRGRYEGRLARGGALPPGYRQTAVRRATEAFEPAEQQERNLLARRGQPVPLASPVARSKARAIGDLEAGFPLLERQLETEDLAGAQGLVTALGRGERGTSRSSSTTIGPPDYGAILAYLGMLAPPQPPIVGRPGTPSALNAGLSQGLNIGLLAYLLGRGRKTDIWGGGHPGA